MNTANSDDPETFQANPNDLLSTSPQFYAAGDAIHQAANSLLIAVGEAAASWDGEAQKKLQTLGNDYVKNLEALAKGMNDIALRLHQGAVLMENTEGRLTRSFE